MIFIDHQASRRADDSFFTLNTIVYADNVITLAQ